MLISLYGYFIITSPVIQVVLCSFSHYLHEWGTSKAISTPYDDDSKDCIGFGICTDVCPTNNIKLEESNQNILTCHIL